MATCPVLPSLSRGSRGSVSTPLLFTETTVAVTARSFHCTLPPPLPAVTSTVPSGSVRVATSDDFSPGPMPGCLYWLTSIDATCSFGSDTRVPSFTWIALHPPNATAAANASPAIADQRPTANRLAPLILVPRAANHSTLAPANSCINIALHDFASGVHWLAGELAWQF